MPDTPNLVLSANTKSDPVEVSYSLEVEIKQIMKGREKLSERKYSSLGEWMGSKCEPVN